MVSGYRIERVLGTGGMGTVYLAKNPTLPRYDAVKVLSSELSRDPGFRARFIREADVASVLDHPNIVSIYSRGETEDGQLWIAMQYVDGTDAEKALQAGAMTPDRAIHIVGEVAKALDYAHRRGVVHHDVKPANFLLSEEEGKEEHVLLGDFGVARALDDSGMPMNGSLMATLAYTAPEVISGGTVDGRADLYSLACTLFRMLTGKKPFFQANGMAAVMMAHLHQDPPKISEYLPWTALELDGVMAQALSKDPAQRYQTAREFAQAAGDAVQAAMRSPQPAAAPAPTAPAQAKGWPTDADAAPPSGHRPAPWTQPSPGSAQSGHLTVNPRPARGSVSAPAVPKRALLVGAAAVVSVALIGGLVFWLTRPGSTSTPSSTPHTGAATTTTTTAAANPADPEDQARLMRQLPLGYPPGACKPTDPAQGALAAVSCAQNTEPGGPPSATYTLVGDRDALRTTFDDILQNSRMVNCPGGIQSPGPWRRNATPNVVSGTLYCGFQQDHPLVAWTDEAKLMVSTIHAEAPGPALDQLYTWWSSHS